jgi:hypothetical protein
VAEWSKWLRSSLNSSVKKNGRHIGKGKVPVNVMQHHSARHESVCQVREAEKNVYQQQQAAADDGQTLSPPDAPQDRIDGQYALEKSKRNCQDKWKAGVR